MSSERGTIGSASNLWYRRPVVGVLVRIPVCAALVISLAASIAGAQSAEQLGARRDLLDRAERANTAGNHAEALNLARRANSIRPSPSLQMFIAQQEVALGQFAAALGDADACVRDATRDTAMGNRDAVISTCHSLLESVRGRLGHLVVRAPNPPPSGLHVTVASAALDPALYDVGTVVTPGTVHIEATADGVTPFVRDVSVAAGGEAEVRLVFARSTQAAADHTNSSSAPPQSASASRAQTNAATSGGGSMRPVLGIVVAVAGVLIAGAGGLFYGLGVSEASAYNNDVSCPGSAVQNTGACQAHLSAGSLDGILAPAGFIAGGVLAVAGIVLFATAPRQHNDRAAANVFGCGVGPRLLGASCTVRF